MTVGTSEGDQRVPRGTVLVADDHRGLRETLAEVLGSAGYDVLQAADGEEALRALRQRTVDVLLLDLAMPRLDGLSVLNALDPPPPKVILHSAFANYSSEDIDDMGLGRKVTSTLRKPCPPLEMLAAINKAMGELNREV